MHFLAFRTITLRNLSFFFFIIINNQISSAISGKANFRIFQYLLVRFLIMCILYVIISRMTAKAGKTVNFDYL